MSTVYLATLSNVETDEFVTFAYGEFPTMKFAVTAGLKKIDGATGDYSARIVEVENIGEQDEKRTVTSITGDAETVAVVVKRKVASERKQYLAETGAPADAPEADASV